MHPVGGEHALVGPVGVAGAQRVAKGQAQVAQLAVGVVGHAPHNVGVLYEAHVFFRFAVYVFADNCRGAEQHRGALPLDALRHVTQSGFVGVGLGAGGSLKLIEVPHVVDANVDHHHVGILVQHVGLDPGLQVGDLVATDARAQQFVLTGIHQRFHHLDVAARLGPGLGDRITEEHHPLLLGSASHGEQQNRKQQGQQPV